MDKSSLIKENILLSKYTTYKTGGKAKFFAEPKCTSELKYLLDYAKNNNLPVEIIGGGSNLLISDNGFDGLIICMASFNMFIINKGNGVVTAGAGLILSEFITYLINKGLAGLESMIGIPGTLGGAVRMNAGAYNTEIKDRCLSVEVMDKNGSIYALQNKEIGFSYRKSEAINGKIVLKADFLLENGNIDNLKQIKSDILEKRREKQPLDKASCGSVFKRPVGNYAGTLIESCGLKGFQIGGAYVSEKHANFILNNGNATSSDIKAVIEHVIKTVKQEKNITLEPEVRMIGF